MLAECEADQVHQCQALHTPDGRDSLSACAQPQAARCTDPVLRRRSEGARPVKVQPADTRKLFSRQTHARSRASAPAYVLHGQDKGSLDLAPQGRDLLAGHCPAVTRDGETPTPWRPTEPADPRSSGDTRRRCSSSTYPAGMSFFYGSDACRGGHVA